MERLSVILQSKSFVNSHDLPTLRSLQVVTADEDFSVFSHYEYV